jgi:transposase
MDSLLSLPIVGIDVSKATLAVCYQVHDQVKHLEVSNTKAGFQQLVAACGAHCQFVMEATGTYNLALAYYL